jgi:hypothetical protein
MQCGKLHSAISRQFPPQPHFGQRRIGPLPSFSTENCSCLRVLKSLSTFKGRGEEAKASVAGRPNFRGGLLKSWVQTIDCLFLLGNRPTILAVPQMHFAKSSECLRRKFGRD